VPRASQITRTKEEDFLKLVDQKHQIEARKNEKDVDFKRRTAAILIQKRYRGWIARKKYKKQRMLAIQLQSLIRGHTARKLFHVTRKRVTLLQAVWRAKVAFKLAQARKKSAQRRFKIIQEMLTTESNLFMLSTTNL
jgi:hypothetical protein